MFIFEVHCQKCHRTGAQLMDDPANNGLDLEPADPGFALGIFRATSLRNVAVTAPYMHDGRFATLREVIDHYSSGVVDGPLRDFRLELQLNLTEEEKAALEAFLNTFTDQQFLSNPKSPIRSSSSTNRESEPAPQEQPNSLSSLRKSLVLHFHKSQMTLRSNPSCLSVVDSRKLPARVLGR